QVRSGCAPAILEGDEARGVSMRTTKIELASSAPFTILDRIPDKEMHTTEIVESLVRTSILVDEDILEGEGKDARDRLFILRGYVDFRCLAQRVHYVAKPVARMRRQLLPPARHQEKPVKLR